MEAEAIDTVRRFVETINTRDAASLSSLMTPNHTFIDAQGTTRSGRETMTSGWQEYFRMFPDYAIQIDDMVQDGNLVAAFGSACGTYNGKRGLVPENRIEMPAAWKAVVEDGKVKLWQVFADWTQGWKIIEADIRAG